MDRFFGTLVYSFKIIVIIVTSDIGVYKALFNNS